MALYPLIALLILVVIDIILMLALSRRWRRQRAAYIKQQWPLWVRWNREGIHKARAEAIKRYREIQDEADE